MAKEIVIWCDPCMGEDTRTPSREHRLSVGGVMKTVDLCDGHYDALVKPVAALIEEYGAPVDAAPTKTSGRRVAARSGREKTGPVPEVTLLTFQQGGIRHGRQPEGGRPTQCLWCPLDYASDGSGFTRHLDTAHGLPGMKVFSGDICCPICGKGDMMQIGSHVKKTHADMGFDSVTQAFLWARDNGDPHVSYAAVLAKAPVLA